MVKFDEAIVTKAESIAIVSGIANELVRFEMSIGTDSPARTKEGVGSIHRLSLAVGITLTLVAGGVEPPDEDGIVIVDLDLTSNKLQSVASDETVASNLLSIEAVRRPFDFATETIALEDKVSILLETKSITGGILPPDENIVPVERGHTKVAQSEAIALILRIANVFHR